MHVMETVAWIWMVVWVVALLVTVWLLVRDPGHSVAREDALSILGARFARGEISREEYEQARDVLLVDESEMKR